MLRRTAGHALDLLDVQRQGGADEPRERRDLLAHGVAPRGDRHGGGEAVVARALVRQRGAEPRRPRASRSWARLMSSSSAQSCMLDGADAERLRASERAVVTLAIANWTDAANGSPADRASADVSAVLHALGSGVGRQINVTFTLDGGADADVAAILETAAVPTIDAASSPFPAATGATVARASTVAMAQDHATMGSLLFACLSGELAPPNVSMVLADRG